MFIFCRRTFLRYCTYTRSVHSTIMFQQLNFFNVQYSGNLTVNTESTEAYIYSNEQDSLPQPVQKPDQTTSGVCLDSLEPQTETRQRCTGTGPTTRRATRLVEGLSHLSYSERLAALQLPTLHFRRQRMDMIQTYKILRDIDKVNYTRECSHCGGSMFQPSLGTITRGHNLKLQVQHQLGPKKHFFSARVTGAWNSLSQSTIDATSIESFKAKLSKEWSTKPDLYQYTFSY